MLVLGRGGEVGVAVAGLAAVDEEDGFQILW